MEDFGKILDRWEHTGQRSSDHTDSSMQAWLERYPPDESKDADRADASAKPPVRPEKIKVDDTLDLHGYHLEEALAETARFIEKSVENGYRKILVIHGKGANGEGVLKREIRTFLEHHPMTGAMGYGRGPQGGRGALWAMLRDKRVARPVSDDHRSR
jgi:DNA-nicking Smr family endonuclease